jgi:4-amino-4-deoxy-L-arabinose transferase-like glycosyltransferase
LLAKWERTETSVHNLRPAVTGSRLPSLGLVLCAAAAALLYLYGLGKPSLWEPDEGRYAEIAREMVVAHDYITPRNNFVRYLEKPPLVYWATAASLKIFGYNEFAVRFPAAVAAVGQVAVTGALAEMVFGSVIGMLAALTLALSPLFFSFARFATPDPALAFFLTAAMACFYAASRAPSFRTIASRLWMLTAAVMLAFGTLAKGPVALVLGGTIALLWLVAERRTRDLLQIPWLSCAVVYLAITLPWFVMVARRNPGFVHFFIVHEHFQRYLANTEHGWGPWFFIPITIGGSWPWLYFALFALSPDQSTDSLLRAKPVESSGPDARATLPDAMMAPAGSGLACHEAVTKTPADNRATEERRAAVRFLLIWFGVIFLFFSIPRSKLGEYILPALPPVAILSGEGLVRLARMPLVQQRRRLTIFTAINASVAATILFGLLLAPAVKLTATLRNDVLVIAGALLIATIAAFILSRKNATVTAIVAPLALAAVVTMAAAGDAREKVAPLVSCRELAAVIKPLVLRGCRMASYRHFEQSLPFYTGVRETLVNYRGELEPFGPAHDQQGIVFATTAQLRRFWASDQCVVLIANRSDLASLTGVLSPVPSVLGCEGKKLALYNRSPSARNAPACQSW